MNLPILPTISTTFIVISAILVAIGWFKIAQRDIEGHKKTMLLAGAAALTFFIIYATRTVFIGNTAFGGPDSIKKYYTIFLIFHITLATVGGALGLFNIITGLKNNLKIHRRLDRLPQSSGSSQQLLVSLFIYCCMYFIKAEKQPQ